MAKKSKRKAAANEPRSPAPLAAALPQRLKQATGGGPGIGRLVSLGVLIGVVVVIGIYFFKVMASFLVPLFLAAVLAVVFKPLHAWSIERTTGRKELAALLTTIVISLLVLVPTALLGWMSYVETTRVVRVLLLDDDPETSGTASLASSPRQKDSQKPTLAQSAETPAAVAEAAAVSHESPSDQPAQSAAGEADESGWIATLWGTFDDVSRKLQEDFGAEIDTSQVARSAARYTVSAGLIGVQTLVSAAIGMSIMIFALYYFFADGPAIIEALMNLSPLDDKYERALLDEFAAVSRAVVLATLLAAVVQGLLGGVGYAFVLDKWAPPAVAAQYEDLDEAPRNKTIRPPVVLLTVATMLLAIVPFVGATAVWIPVTLWVYFVQGDLWPAVGMAIYGTAVVSSIDNVIKPLVLHGQSNLHPLLALLSVLGGIQVLGPVGILVGPMLAAFLQALLGMLRQELDRLQREEADEPAPA